MRNCGECTLCCKLLPVVELDKGACEVCKHQRYAKGCAIYTERPSSCITWSCGWLLDEELDPNFKRPDKAHYLIDPAPDYVTVFDNISQETIRLPVLQIWVDPKYPNAHRDKALRNTLIDNYLIGIVRFNSNDALTLIPPAMNMDKQWAEVVGDQEDEHTPAQIVDALRSKS